MTPEYITTQNVDHRSLKYIIVDDLKKFRANITSIS